MDINDFHDIRGLFSQTIEPLEAIVTELRRLNANLESGQISIRTHHPLCVTPKLGTDYTIVQLDAMGKFLNASIEDGRLKLPPREGDGS